MDCAISIDDRSQSGLCVSCVKKGKPTHNTGIYGPNSHSWKGGRVCYYHVQAREIVDSIFDLQPHNVVHHKDGDYENNQITNLAVFETQGDHAKFHRNKHKVKPLPIWDGEMGT